jgi:hypothetical protein
MRSEIGIGTESRPGVQRERADSHYRLPSVCATPSAFQDNHIPAAHPFTVCAHASSLLSPSGLPTP